MGAAALQLFSWKFTDLYTLGMQLTYLQTTLVQTCCPSNFQQMYLENW